MSTADLRRLPSVEQLAQSFEQVGGSGHPRTLIVECAREVLDGARTRLLRDEPVDLTPEVLLAEVGKRLQHRTMRTLTRAANATGIILHTNLGRAPLSERAQRAVAEVAEQYSTLEVEQSTGRRGSRHQHIEPPLTRLTGAEAAYAVNNNAAAVMLALAALARGKEVIVSRGELVEIGGSFRLPDVMAQSGATLVEVGTTNRTYLRDYERAITAQTAMLLKVHRSNFAMQGFVHETSVDDLVDLGRRRGIPVMYDLGSGCLVDLRTRGLPYEPTVPDAVRAGCDVVTFSGDKLLGGPQAGVIVGRSRFLEPIRSHPLARAVRLDKLDIAALTGTLQEYLDPQRVWETLPVLRMLSATPDALRATAATIVQTLGSQPEGWKIEVAATTAEVGGGSLPEAHLPSFAVAVRAPFPPDRLEAALRAHQPPVFARISDGAVLLDVRTLLPGDETVVAEALKKVMSSPFTVHHSP